MSEFITVLTDFHSTKFTRLEKQCTVITSWGNQEKKWNNLQPEIKYQWFNVWIHCAVASIWLLWHFLAAKQGLDRRTQNRWRQDVEVGHRRKISETKGYIHFVPNGWKQSEVCKQRCRHNHHKKLYQAYQCREILFGYMTREMPSSSEIREQLVFKLEPFYQPCCCLFFWCRDLIESNTLHVNMNLRRIHTKYIINKSRAAVFVCNCHIINCRKFTCTIMSNTNKK